MANKVRLTNENYKTIRCPISKRKLEVPCSLIRGVYAEYRPHDLPGFAPHKLTWWLRYTCKVTGKLKHYKIGSGDLSIGQARDIARKLRSK